MKSLLATSLTNGRRVERGGMDKSEAIGLVFTYGVCKGWGGDQLIPDPLWNGAVYPPLATIPLRPPACLHVGGRIEYNTEPAIVRDSRSG